MPDHFHLLLLPDVLTATVAEALHSLKRPVAERLIRDGIVPRRSDGPTRVWEPGGGFDRNIFSDEELFEKARYIEMNPVRAGFVKAPEEWAWSSASWRRGDRSGPVQVDPLPR